MEHLGNGACGAQLNWRIALLVCFIIFLLESVIVKSNTE